jgi:hypothetical protein
MIENGYAMLGYSSFTGPQWNQNQAIDKAKELKASVVVLYSKFLDTRSELQPVVIPDIKISTSSGQATAFGSAYGSGGYASGSATAFGTGTSTTSTQVFLSLTLGNTSLISWSFFWPAVFQKLFLTAVGKTAA